MRAPTGRATADATSQGRAGLVAWRRSRGGVGALGQAFYKGGFEPRMNRREATLILSLKCVFRPRELEQLDGALTSLQRTSHHQRQAPEGAPNTYAAQPPRPRWESLPSDQGQRGKRVLGEGGLIWWFGAVV